MSGDSPFVFNTDLSGPPVDFRRCPHCQAYIDVAEVEALEAHTCPKCDDPYYIDIVGDLIGITWDEVVF